MSIFVFAVRPGVFKHFQTHSQTVWYTDKDGGADGTGGCHSFADSSSSCFCSLLLEGHSACSRSWFCFLKKVARFLGGGSGSVGLCRANPSEFMSKGINNFILYFVQLTENFIQNFLFHSIEVYRVCVSAGPCSSGS